MHTQLTVFDNGGVSYAYTQGSFQLLVRVDDNDAPLSPDLIDRVIINANLAAGSSISATTYTGFYGKATMRMAVSVRCDTNFYGSNCVRYCAPRDDSTGHYTCDGNGNIVCRSGWTNAATNCITRTYHSRHLQCKCFGVNLIYYIRNLPQQIYFCCCSCGVCIN